MESNSGNFASTAKLEVGNRNHNKIAPQLVAGLLANFMFFETGMTFGWSTPTLPKLLAKDSDIPTTSEDASWIVSGMSIGAIFGPIVSAFLVNRIGRKWFLYAITIPYLVSWTMIFFANSFTWLFVARFISGLPVGATFTVVPIYISEITETKLRGTLGTIGGTLLLGGSLMMYIIGPWVSRKTLALVSTIPQIFLLLTFAWMPDTPYYYLYKNRPECAKKSLKWLRGTSSIDDELNEMILFVESEQQQRGKFHELITVPGNRRATLITWIMLSAQQVCGYLVITSYMSIFFEEMNLGSYSDTAVIVVGVISIFSNLFTNCIIDRIGRKPLFLTSSIGTCISVTVIGIYFCVKSFDVDVSRVSWIPILALVISYIFFPLGLGSIPYAVLSEIYPTGVKGWASMVTSIYGSLMGFLVVKLYQIVADSWGLFVILFIFAFSELVFAILIVIYMPETKGKTFSEIQEIIGRKGKSEKNHNADIFHS